MNAALMRIRRRSVVLTGDWPDAVHPVLRRVYAARGVTDIAQVSHRLGGLLPPTRLGGLDRAVALLLEAIARDLHICVIGDFDCDGATGTAVAVRGLRLLGARRVSYRVPHRMRHGYGLSPALVADLSDLSPDLLLTVDDQGHVTAFRPRLATSAAPAAEAPAAEAPAAPEPAPAPNP